MTRTLYAYISCDLVKVMLMALLALTGVMTVIGVIEPMRERGLSGGQVLSLFGFMVPGMMSLTLPIAALFAATFVYGRFSQNNELLAARASGVSAVALLTPALALGLLITVLALVLSNYVAPAMAGRAERFVTANIEGFVYHQLRTKSCVDKGLAKRLVHASEVSPEHHLLRGVVVADTRDPADVRFLVAPRASAYFDSADGENFATFALSQAAMARTGKFGIVRAGDITVESLPLPSLAKESPSWYDWDELCATLDNPSRNGEIRQILAKIRQRICKEKLSRRVLEAVNAGRTCRLTDGLYDYDISAGGAEIDSSGAVVLGTHGSRRVRVVEFRRHSRQVRRTILADGGKVGTTWSVRSNTMSAVVETLGNVTVHAGEPDRLGDAPRHSQWSIGPLLVPEDIIESVEAISLADIYRDPESHTSNERLLHRLGTRVTRLRGKIRGEMNGRIAYGLSCCLMVALGGALGLIFRGGQVLSAFAISVAPAMLVIVMIAMGKQQVSNPGVPLAVGLAAIWSGLVLLLAANAWAYARLMRR